MTPHSGRSLVQVLVVRADIGVVSYEDMTPQCARSVVQVLVVRADIGVVSYEDMTPQCARSVVQGPGCQSGYSSNGEFLGYDSAVWEVIGSGPAGQSEYRIGDL